MSMLRHNFLSLTIAIACSLVCSVSAMGGVIVNGDFSTRGADPPPFAGWSTLTEAPESFLEPTYGGGVARFTVDQIGERIQLQQMFDLPSGATELKFDFMLSSTGNGMSGGMLNDVFQAALFSPSGGGINPIAPPSLNAFFSVDATGREDAPLSGVHVSSLGASSAWRQVSLTLPSLTPGKYTIEFLMLGVSDERTTTVDVDNVMVSQDVAAIPEPASLVIWGLLGTGALPVFLWRRRKTVGQEKIVGRMM